LSSPNKRRNPQKTRRRKQKNPNAKQRMQKHYGERRAKVIVSKQSLYVAEARSRYHRGRNRTRSCI
jgi:hypothetical protein